MGWDGEDGKEAQEGGDICVHIWLMHAVVQQKLTQHCKAITLQFKNNEKKFSPPHSLLE